MLRDGRAEDGVHPIVDVVFPGIHFDSVRAKDRKAGFIPYVVPAGRPKREFHRILTADRQPHIKSRCEHLRARGYEMASRSERLESFWPNLSLRPGLTDARRVLAVGEMDTDPLMWPWYFETEFACRYFLLHNDTVTGSHHHRRHLHPHQRPRCHHAIFLLARTSLLQVSPYPMIRVSASA